MPALGAGRRDRQPAPHRLRLGFLISLIFTPLVGLIVALLTDPLPGEDRRWGCIGTLLALLGLVSLVVFLLLLLAGGMLLVA